MNHHHNENRSTRRLRRKLAKQALVGSLALLSFSGLLFEPVWADEPEQVPESEQAQTQEQEEAQPQEQPPEQPPEQPQPQPAKQKFIEINNDFNVTNNSVSGPGAASSYLNNNRGWRYYDYFNFRYNPNKAIDKFWMDISLNATDDKQAAYKSLALTNFSAGYQTKMYEWQVGDASAWFSGYSLTTSFKGVTYTHHSPNNRAGLQYTVISGLMYPMWDNFWDNNNPNIKTIRRSVTGVRISNKSDNNQAQYLENLIIDVNADPNNPQETQVNKPKMKKFDWGISYVRTSDSQPVYDFDTLYDTDIIAADWKYKPSKLWSISGEHALGKTSSTIPQLDNHDSQDGQAHKVEVLYQNKNRKNFRLTYERIDPKYFTLTGGATPDREKISSFFSRRISNNLTATASLQWGHDNLDGHLPTTTTSWVPNVGFNLKHLFGREYSMFSFNANGSITYQTPDITGLANGSLDFGYQDRFGVIFTGLNYSVGRDFRAAWGYQDEYRQRNQNFSITMNTNSIRGKTTLSPSFYYGNRRQKNDLTGLDIFRTFEKSIALSIGNDEKGLYTSIRLGTNKLVGSNGLMDKSDNWFGQFELSKTLSKKENRESIIYIRYSLNDYGFGDEMRNYRENRMTLGIRTRL